MLALSRAGPRRTSRTPILSTRPARLFASMPQKSNEDLESDLVRGLKHLQAAQALDQPVAKQTALPKQNCELQCSPSVSVPLRAMRKDIALQSVRCGRLSPA
jgi:hypothetical protein